MLPLYGAIVVPEEPESARVVVLEAVRNRVSYVGPVMLRERAESMPRDEARALLGVPGGATAVYVSAGGGGDPDAERTLHATVDALVRDASVHVVVGAGPLYRGRPRYGPRISW